MNKLLILLACLLTGGANAGYLVDSQGQPVRSDFGLVWQVQPQENSPLANTRWENDFGSPRPFMASASKAVPLNLIAKTIKVVAKRVAKIKPKDVVVVVTATTELVKAVKAPIPHPYIRDY